MVLAKGKAMLKRIRETFRKCPFLSPLLCLYGVVIAVLAAFYYQQGFKLWYAVLQVPLYKNADSEQMYLSVARGPSLLLPWHLLPQHVFWMALAVLIIGSLTIWWSWRCVENEMKHQIAGREKAAADKLLEAEEQSAVADRRMREAEKRKQQLKALETRAEARESEAVNRELAAQAHMKEKDAEVKKMNQALTRLKTEVSELRKEVRRLRRGS